MAAVERLPELSIDNEYRVPLGLCRIMLEVPTSISWPRLWFSRLACSNWNLSDADCEAEYVGSGSDNFIGDPQG